MTQTPSRPARAMRGAAVVVALAAAARMPAVRAEFRNALAAGRSADRRSASNHDGPRPPFGSTTSTLGTGRQALVADHGVTLAQAVRASSNGRSGTDRAKTRQDGALTDAAALAEEQIGPVGAVAMAPLPPPSTVRPLVAADPVVAAVASPAGGGAAAPTPFDLATAAYARLAAGDRRGAAGLFDAAIAADDPRAVTWRRERDALTRHWSGSAYSIVRDGGPAGFATEPVLGGGQSGGSLSYTIDPLTRRPVAVFARGTIAHDDGGRTSFAAIGVQWRPLAGVTVAAERLIAIGPAGPGAWSVRVGAGTDRIVGRLRATAYGEGGLIGTATYAAAQARVAGIVHLDGIEIDPGGGVWSSVQHDRGPALDRVDVGPGVTVRAGRFGIAADYRFRVAGDAAPDSGPVLTLTAGF